MDRHPVDNGTGVFRQDVTVSFRIFVDGPRDGFAMTVGSLQERIENHIKSLIPARLHKGIDQIYASRGPSGSRFYFPGEVIEETGLWIGLDKLP